MQLWPTPARWRGALALPGSQPTRLGFHRTYEVKQPIVGGYRATWSNDSVQKHTARVHHRPRQIP